MNIDLICGFINTDGCFSLDQRVSTSKLGYIIIYSISIAQDGISKIVLDALVQFFKIWSST
jgi:LAGLIDADG DNA endonuclease family protein